jgi:YD repeat-containing protein
VSSIQWSLIKKTGAAGAGTNARQAYDAYGRSVAITGEIFAVGAPSQSYDSSGSSYVASAGASVVYFR